MRNCGRCHTCGFPLRSVLDRYRVEEIFNEGGGVSTPLGDQTQNAREFCAAVYFAERVLEQYQKAQEAIPEAQGYPVPVR